MESSIAEKLSWEIIAWNDKGDAPEAQRTALEIAYGMALAHEAADGGTRQQRHRRDNPAEDDYVAGPCLLCRDDEVR